MSTSVQEDVDLGALESLDFEIACEIPTLPNYEKTRGSMTPECPGDKAIWVGWRWCTCASPSYLLLCDSCKKDYDVRTARWDFLSCAWCGRDVQPMMFMPLGET